MQKLKNQYDEIHEIYKSKTLNVLLGIACLVFFLYPMNLTFWIIINIPIVGLLLNGLVNRDLASMIKFNHDGKGLNIPNFIFAPALSLILTLVLRFQISNWKGLIIYALAILLVPIFLLYVLHPMRKKSFKSIFSATRETLFILCLFSYFVAYGLNIFLDNSYAEIYKTEVIRTEISKGKGKSSGRTSYYALVKPWGEIEEINKISISKSKFDFLEPGDTLEILRNKGYFDVKWFRPI